MWDNVSTAMDNRAEDGDFEYEPYFKEYSTDPVDPNYVMISSYNGQDSDVVIPSTLGGKPVKAVNHMIWGDITSVTFPDTVTDIHTGAFSNYQNLTTINFTEGLEIIGYRAFAGCRALESVELPDGLKCVYPEAFRFCRSLKTVYVPDSIEWIYEGAFDDTTEDCEIHYKGQVYTPDEIDDLFKDAPLLTIQ